MVIHQSSTALELEIDGQRWVARGRAPLPAAGGQGARVTLELARGEAGEQRAARLVRTGAGRLNAPIELVLKRAAGPGRSSPASHGGEAPPAPVTVRPLAEGRRPLPARLSVVHPSSARPEPVSSGAPAAATPPVAPPPRARPGGAAAAPSSTQSPARAVPGAGMPGRPGLPQPPAKPDPVPAQRPPGPPAAAPDSELEGEVVGSDPAHRLLLRIGQRLLQVQEPLHLPEGARVRLSMARADALALDQEPGAERLQPGPAPALRPDTALAGRLLDLARALGGEPMQPEPDAGADPGAARAVRVQIKALGQGFRLVEVPFGVEGQQVPLRLHLLEDPADRRQGSAGGSQNERSSPKRAIVAVDLEHLGACQLDVLCHGRRFDLRVRSERPLPDRARSTAMQLFLAARDLGGLEGEMVFAPGELLVFEAVPSAIAAIEA